MLVILLTAGAVFSQAQPTHPLHGAWHHQDGDREQIVVFVDGYFSHSIFDSQNKVFQATRGGTYTATDNQIAVTWQYDTDKAEQVPASAWAGKSTAFDYAANGTLTLTILGEETVFQRLDSNQTPLAGVWRITGRQQADGMSQMPLRDRRTLKILTGTRFQWVAINVKTGQFSGTGGGTYTFANGKYTENIDFFSRNADRVGASLTFDGKIENGNWHHSGLSSAGEPIYEVWSRNSL